MRAVWNDTLLAEAEQGDLIRIEGNWYFPPDSLTKAHFTPSEKRTTCAWKGEAEYYDITVDGALYEAGAWYYPKPLDGAIERVKQDFTNYVAFWPDIEIKE